MTTARNRLQPEDRRSMILEAAVQMAADKGYNTLTRDGVARAARVSPALVTFYFLAVSELRRAVMEEAVRRELLGVVAEGLVLREPAALAAPAWLKARALAGVGV